MKNSKVVKVFTARGLDRMLSDGGSKAWVLDAKRAAKCSYVLCVQNRGFADDWGKATAPHKNAFFIGKISSVVPAPGFEDERYLIKISEYAELNIPDAWPGNRNPVTYTTLEEEGIDISGLEFNPMPVQSTVATDHFSDGLTIEQAKAGLSMKFGVSPEKIQITITS